MTYKILRSFINKKEIGKQAYAEKYPPKFPLFLQISRVFSDIRVYI